MAAFWKLQCLFSHPGILVHFNHLCQLYINIDASKERGLGAIAYHESELTPSIKDGNPKQKAIQPILFMSHLLTDAETHYWPTELEVQCLVWSVTKLQHMIEASELPTVIIYTDHSATVGIVKQTSMMTSSIAKTNLRLIWASEYLQRFQLDIHYIAGRQNIIADALLRLERITDKPKSDPDYRINEDELMAHYVAAHPAAVIKISTEFKQ